MPRLAFTEAELVAVFDVLDDQQSHARFEGVAYGPLGITLDRWKDGIRSAFLKIGLARNAAIEARMAGRSCPYCGSTESPLTNTAGCAALNPFQSEPRWRLINPLMCADCGGVSDRADFGLLSSEENERLRWEAFGELRRRP